jgi:hypothetical protein
LRTLLGLIDHDGSSSEGPPTAADRARIAKAWRVFIAKKKSDVVANRRIPVDDPSVTSALLPPGTLLQRKGEQWPVQKTP